MTALRMSLAGLFAVGRVLAAQSGHGELSGTVRDATGLPISGASIEIRETATGAVYQAPTQSAGEFHFFALPPGRIDLTAGKDGFRQLRRLGIQVQAGDRLHLDLTLEVGEVSEVLDVHADAPLLRLNRGTAAFVVEQKTVTSLPLDGRNFVPLVALLPGVSLPPGSVLPRINGSRPRVSEYIYDGISVLQPEPGQVAFYPIVEAIEEFRVETNSYSAEYGRSNGGVILVHQRSGSNAFHGTVFEFFRNESLNARNLFAAQGEKPRFRRNQYGFVLGGPIKRNRAFFFLDWQRTGLDTGVVRTSTVPVSPMKAGVFSVPVFDPATTVRTETGWQRQPFAGNIVPASRFDPAAAAALARYPAPNVFAGGREATANNYIRTGTERTKQDRFDARLDRYFGSVHRVFGRWSYLRDRSIPTPPLPDGSGAIRSGVIGDTLTRAQGVVAEHTWTLSPSAVNQARFGYTRRGFDRRSLRTGRPASEISGVPGIPQFAFADVLPALDLTGYQQIGPPAGGNAEFATSVTQFIDTFSQTRGPHSLKLGADVRLQHLDVLQPPSPTGTFQFSSVLTSNLSSAGTPAAGTGNSVASFLLGQVQSFSLDVQREVLQPRATVAEFFLQDDWRAAPRLSLNAGVRYTLNFPSTEARNRAAVFDLRTQQLNFLGRNGIPRAARELEKANCGPRLGLAYRLTDSFLVRAGYGLTWIEQAGITTPFTTPLFPFLRTVEQRSLDNLQPAFVLSRGPSVDAGEPAADSGLGQGVFAVQRDQKSGYAQQWNFMLQKTFGAGWSLEAGYLGSKLTNLGVPDVNLNQLRVEQLALGAELTRQAPNPFYGMIPASSSLGGPAIARQQLLRPYPRFTTVTLYRNNVGHSTYHSLQGRIERRFSGGLAFTAAYTFSRLIDDAGAVFDSAVLAGPVIAFQVADSHNRRIEKDVSTGSIPHAFSAGFVYELPFGAGRSRLLNGWRLAGIVRLQSGSPVAVTQATNLNAFAGFGIQWPNRNREPNLPKERRTTTRYFDTSAFSLAPQFTIGTSSRNPVNGPGYRTLDLMAGKTFSLREPLALEFRAEAFNLTNTPPLGNPDGSFGTAAFGSITTALDPRVFEFVLKLVF
ncbi:MAG: TonB-dependent receptor [Acidobacteriota bacterium]